MKPLIAWITWMTAGFYLTAISLALTVVVLIILYQSATYSNFDVGFWDGILTLATLPIYIGGLVVIASISGTLVSGTRFVNQGLAEGEKSHNPLWGVFMWLVPGYGFYKAFVMGRSIERETGPDTYLTLQLSFGLFVSWILGVISEVSSRTGLDAWALFMASLLLQSLITVTWIYMANQVRTYLKGVRVFALALQAEESGVQQAEVATPSKTNSDSNSEPANKFCTNCGQKRSLGSKFCGECGSSFGGQLLP